MQVAYPKALEKDHWDKKKGIIAKTKPTGIGKLLKQLKTDHAAIKWDNFKTTWGDAFLAAYPKIAETQDLLEKVCDTTIAALAQDADAVAKLATTWEGKFKADKLIPAGAAKACKEVADAAAAFADELGKVKAQLDVEAKAAQKKSLEAIRSAVGPSLAKANVKITQLVKDLNAFTANATKENFDKFATGDGSARGFTTACQTWDSVLAKSAPWVCNGIYKGKAMDEFFPLMKDYGAGYSDWDARMDKLAKEKNGTVEQAYKFHAKACKTALASVEKFQGYVADAIEALK